jgi:hypothetical protein
MKKNTFNGSLLVEKLRKLNTSIPRKQKPKPGSLLRKTDTIVPGVEFFYKDRWVKIPNNSIIMGHTVGLINEIEQTKYRYPL